MSENNKNYEFSIQNLYFHENASIYTIDSNNNHILTGGGDKAIRQWTVNLETITHTIDVQNEAFQSSVKIIHDKNFEKHSKLINCVRYSQDGRFFVSGADSGEVFLWYNDEIYVIREIDNDDIYEILIEKNNIFAVSASGKIHVYEFTISSNETEPEKKDVQVKSKLIQSLKIHSDIIQGMCYNRAYNILVTSSKDRSFKLYNFDKKLLFHDKIDSYEESRIFADESSKVLFRRPSFSHCGNFLYLVAGEASGIEKNQYFVHVLHYPFRSMDFYAKIGPLDSYAIKVICTNKINAIMCKKNIYLFSNDRIVLNIKNSAFFPLTDGCYIDNCFLFSSLDGFLYSLRLNERVKDDIVENK